MPSIDINAKVNVIGGGAQGGGLGSKEGPLLEVALRRLIRRADKTLDADQIATMAQTIARFNGSMQKLTALLDSLGSSTLSQHKDEIQRLISSFAYIAPSHTEPRETIRRFTQPSAGQPPGPPTAGGGGKPGDNLSGAAMLRGGVAGVLAYAGIKIVQKATESIGAAQDVAIQYHDLRERVGGAAVDFDRLKNSIALFSKGLSLTTEQQAALAKTYAENSLEAGAGAERKIAEGVGQGSALSRGFGIDPQVGVGFMGIMRRFGLSNGSERDNQKLAYMIGDAVGKTGSFAKADDVINAVARFTEVTTRNSLQTANAVEYAGLMGSLGRLRLPGLDAMGGSGIINKLVGSWSNAGGEPGMALRLGWAQRHGLNAWDMPAIGAAGPFATYRSTFGPGSVRYETASEAEKKRLAAVVASGGDKMFYSEEMDALSRNYSDTALPHAMQAMYGFNDPESRAMLKGYRDPSGKFANLRKTIQEVLGDKADSVNPQQMPKLAMAVYGSDADRQAMAENAKRYSGSQALTKDERHMLASAENSGDQGALTKALIAINAKRETVDEGSEARKAQVELNNKFKEWAEQILPLTTLIQKGIFRIVDWLPGSNTDKLRTLEAEYDEKFNKKPERTEAEINADEKMDRREKADAITELRRKKALTEVAGGRRQYIMKRLIGAGYEDYQAAGIVGSLMQESGPSLDHKALNPKTGAYGIAQWLSKDRVAAFKKFTGKDIHDSTFEEQVDFLMHEMAQRGDMARIRGTKSARNAAVMHERVYEIAGKDAEHAKRVNYAERALAEYQDTRIPDNARPTETTVIIKGSADFNLRLPDGSVQRHQVPLTGIQERTFAGAPA